MELETSQIDLESIEVKGSFPEPDPEQVKYLAHAISTVGGLIQVPVVRQLDLETYELVHGYFEYQAYLKAREINPELPDRMRVFVITKKNEPAIQQQLEVFETLAGERGGGTTDPVLISKLSNLMSAFEVFQKDVRSTTVKNHQAILEAIDAKLPTPLPPLETFNRIDEPLVAKQALDKLSKALSESKAQQIIEKLQKYRKKKPEQPLCCFAEVIEAAGKDSRGRNRLLTEKTMLKIIDSW